MPVTVDDRPLATEALGLSTIGQVLSHLQRDNRLVVNVLIDGQEPDLDRLALIKQSPLGSRSLFIETADPKEMALEVLAEVAAHLEETDAQKIEAAELLQQGQHSRAMERLAGCFTAWQHAQESVLKTAQLLRIDLAQVRVDGRPLTELLQEFMQQLRDIRRSLEDRDFVLLGDILMYETSRTSELWKDALEAMRDTVAAVACPAATLSGPALPSS